MAKPAYLFVYGLLRSDVGGPMQPTLAEEGWLIGAARWRGSIYRVGEFPGAVPCDAEAYVVGELYEVSEDLLARLDDYEQVPEDYVRAMTSVETDAGAYEAWIYLWNRSTEDCRRIDSGDFAADLT